MANQGGWRGVAGRMVRGVAMMAAIGIGVTVPGCAVKQPPPPADALKGRLPPTTVVPPAWTPAAAIQGDVIGDWVSTFGDPQLNAVVAEGLQNNLDLQAAAARIESAAALVVQARSLLYPHLGINGGVGVVGRDEVHDRNGAMLDISWELDLWGRVRAQKASAVATREAFEADRLAARQSLAASMATLWFESITAERQRRAAEESVGVYANLLELVRNKVAIGQVSQQDIALASADMERARRREREFATTEQQVVRGLEVMLGRYPSAELELALSPDLPPLPPPVPDGLPAQLLERRPDLVAAERRLAAAFHLIQAAEAARLPKIALTLAGGRSSSELLALAGVPPEFWKAGLDIVAPLFTGGALKAEVARATADQQAALAQYAQAALHAFSEVETSLSGEQLLADQQRAQEAVLAQDTEALRLGRIRYDVGSSDLLHVLQLQARQLQSRFDLIGLRHERLANRIALHLALGGGFAMPPAAP